MKKLWVALAALLAVAAIGVSAASATSKSQDRGNVFCLSSFGTITTPFYGFGKTDGGQQIVLTTQIAYIIIDNFGGDFRVTAGPKAGTYHIDAGACPGDHFVPPPATGFVCYSKWQVEPMAVPIAEAKVLVASGYWLPWAVKNGKSITNIGNGYHLQCNLDPGMTQGLLAIGGGGETYFGTQALNLFVSNPEDFYHDAS